MHHDKNYRNTFIHKALNPYSDDNRWVYLISDPPHLIITIRNFWSHSGTNGTRLMQVYYYILNSVIILFYTVE